MPQVPSDERGQNLPNRAARACRAHESNDPHDLARLGAKGHARAVVVYVENPVPTPRALRRPIPAREAHLMVRERNHALCDKSPTLRLDVRARNEANCWIRRRESLVTHGGSTVLRHIFETTPPPPLSQPPRAVPSRNPVGPPALGIALQDDVSVGHAIRFGITLCEMEHQVWSRTRRKMTSNQSAAGQRMTTTNTESRVTHQRSRDAFGAKPCRRLRPETGVSCAAA